MSDIIPLEVMHLLQDCPGWCTVRDEDCLCIGIGDIEGCYLVAGRLYLLHETGDQFVSIGMLVSRVNVGVLDSIASRILDLTSGRAEVVSSDVDASTRAMFTVFPREFTAQVEALLGREDVARLRLPEELSGGPPDVALQALQRQMSAIPQEISKIQRDLSGLAVEWCEKLPAWRAALADEIDANSIFPRLGETDMTFVIAGWVPHRISKRYSRLCRRPSIKSSWCVSFR